MSGSGFFFIFFFKKTLFSFLSLGFFFFWLLLCPLRTLSCFCFVLFYHSYPIHTFSLSLSLSHVHTHIHTHTHSLSLFAAEFPTIVLELKEEELTDVLGPADFAIGQTVHIFGRPFLLYDCDGFTKEFYRRNFGVEDFAPVSVDKGEAPAYAKVSG